jgi:hypothetical protein
LAWQAEGDHRRVPARHPLAGPQSRQHQRDQPDDVPGLLLQCRSRREQRGGRHSKGRNQLPHKGQVYDYERGGPADITTPYWLTDDAVSSSSWCYTQGMQYYTDAAVGITRSSTASARAATCCSIGAGKVYLFAQAGGQPTELQATQDGSGLHVTLPSTKPYAAVAYAIKISKGAIPPTSTPMGTDGGVPSTGGISGSQDAGAGAGGNLATGGRISSGGTTSVPAGSGGASASGGASSSGGAAGNPSTGGRTGSAGNTSMPFGSGGANGSGGATLSASTPPSSTGGAGAGGISTAGGMSASGGTSAGSGGASSNSSGGAGHGGANAGGAAGQIATPEPNGCSCNTLGSRRASAAGSLLLFGLVVAARVRRRRR